MRFLCTYEYIHKRRYRYRWAKCASEIYFFLLHKHASCTIYWWMEYVDLNTCGNIPPRFAVATVTAVSITETFKRTGSNPFIRLRIESLNSDQDWYRNSLSKKKDKNYQFQISYFFLRIPFSLCLDNRFTIDPAIKISHILNDGGR